MPPNKVLNVDKLVLWNTTIAEAQDELGLSWLLALSPEVMFFLFCLKPTELTAYIWFFVVEYSIQEHSVNTENFLNITIMF